MRIRLAILCGTALLLAGMSAASIQVRDAKERLAVREQSKPHPLPAHVTLDLLAERIDGIQYEVRLRLSNPTNAPIYFSSRRPGWPEYEVEYWREESCYRRGRGWTCIPPPPVKECALPPGGSLEFTHREFVHSPPFRVEVAYERESGLQSEFPLRVRTERIEPPEHVSPHRT